MIRCNPLASQLVGVPLWTKWLLTIFANFKLWYIHFLPGVFFLMMLPCFSSTRKLCLHTVNCTKIAGSFPACYHWSAIWVSERHKEGAILIRNRTDASRPCLLMEWAANQSDILPAFADGPWVTNPLLSFLAFSYEDGICQGFSVNMGLIEDLWVDVVIWPEYSRITLSIRQVNEI